MFRPAKTVQSGEDASWITQFSKRSSDRKLDRIDKFCIEVVYLRVSGPSPRRMLGEIVEHRAPERCPLAIWRGQMCVLWDEMEIAEMK